MNQNLQKPASANVAAPQKPIRFVTNHDGPYAKRRRITSACLTCRRKKTRCSGERPVCNTCLQAKHECAGYGDDSNSNNNNNNNTNNNSSNGGDSKENRRSNWRESNGEPSHASRAPSQRIVPPPLRPPSDAPIDPQLTRPRLTHSASNFSQNSDSTPGRMFKGDDDGNSSTGGLSLSTRNRMPYFRYFGPTAILPGLRQMVVKVRERQHGSAQTASDQNAVESSPAQPLASPPIVEATAPIEIPVYDTSPMSPSPLITHLCKIFFVHLGCSFPFLQRDRFMRDLEEKQVDAILVDAVCALAARFSSHPLMTGTDDVPKDGESTRTQVQPSEYGQTFAQRAKSAIPDAFPCPSVAVVQAALLLAYDEFGASRDSGLWMYLGIAIRMSQDLGLQTLGGLRYEGRSGPTPHSIKAGTDWRKPSPLQEPAPEIEVDESEQRAAERERLDTFWSIFFLDRVISSGTGRPVTLRDRDIDISFPSLDEVDPVSGWPIPYPALIRIIHLYGRVTDLVNRIREPSDINEDLQKQLGSLEDRLTLIYQNLSPRLHFNAVNFQQYVKFNQGTNFLLLHVWFHALIVLLHQPTLLKPFEGAPKSLSTNSRELSMSSAKTIADILSFTELIDAKAGMGNPFTSQPIYIAACAFLNETAIHSASSQPQSRPSTPGSRHSESSGYGKQSLDHMEFAKPLPPSTSSVSDREQKQAAKHTLLASAANQNYQRCYRALKALETYWAGVKYIMTVLDQKATGVADPLLYTREEIESALEAPRTEPAFTSPGWRRKLSWGTYLTAQSPDPDVAKMAAALRKGAGTPAIPGSPMVHPSQAIGWSLTGTMNSPSTNVAVMYSSDNNNNNARESQQAASRPQKTKPQPSIASVISEPAIKYEANQGIVSPATANQFNHATMPPPPVQGYGVPVPDPVMVSDADLLLNLHTPYSNASPASARSSLPNMPTYPHTASIPGNMQQPQQDFSPNYTNYGTPTDHGFGDMVIDAQDIDMSMLSQDMMPWDIEYLPHDLLYFGDGSFPNNGLGDGSNGADG